MACGQARFEILALFGWRTSQPGVLRIGDRRARRAVKDRPPTNTRSGATKRCECSLHEPTPILWRPRRRLSFRAALPVLATAHSGRRHGAATDRPRQRAGAAKRGDRLAASAAVRGHSRLRQPRRAIVLRWVDRGQCRGLARRALATAHKDKDTVEVDRVLADMAQRDALRSLYNQIMVMMFDALNGVAPRTARRHRGVGYGQAGDARRRSRPPKSFRRFRR